MAFSERFLEDLIARCDIVDVVSDYVQLSKKSGNNMFGLCPFHSEKTPSFSVSADKQIYHCFGCGKGGGVINFIMEMENLPFPDAVQFLANKAGIPVPDDEEDTAQRGRRTRLLELNRDAARFFYENLKDPRGAAAVEYIKKRGISPTFVKKFGLGAAFNEWNSLSDAMLKKGYTASELMDAGLCKKGQRGGIYDVFRNRLVFPVIDIRGSVIGFSGRILDDGEPKYLNSPDTMVFSKSRNLFAMNLAKKSKRGMIILAEGNIDVVSLHQAGFDCAVASLGTSLTPDQVRLISRYTENVVIAYDSDEAGRKAAQRAISLLEKTGINVKVLSMSGAKDPDEYIKKNGADAFSTLLDKSENHIEYRLMAVRDKYELSTDDGKVAFLREATEMLSQIPNAMEREIYGRRVAEYAGISPEAVTNEVSKAYRRRRASENKKYSHDTMRAGANAQPQEKTMRYENVASAMAEEGIIRLLLMDNALIEKTEGLTQEDFTSECLGKTFRIIKERGEGYNSVSAVTLTAYLTPEEMSLLSSVLQKPETPANGEEKLRGYIDRIKTEKQRSLMKKDPLAAMREIRQKKGFVDKNE